MKNIPKKALIILLMFAVIFPMFTVYNTVNAEELKHTLILDTTDQRKVQEEFEKKYPDEKIILIRNEIVYKYKAVRMKYKILETARKYTYEKAKEAAKKNIYNGYEVMLSYIDPKTYNYGANEYKQYKVSYSVKYYEFVEIEGYYRSEKDIPKSMIPDDTVSMEVSGKKYKYEIISQKKTVETEQENNGGSSDNNGGSTGNNAGSSDNNGGSTGNNGGSSNNNGGSAGNNGGSSNNNGGSTGNNGNSSGTTEDTEVYTSELKVGDKLKFKAKSWFLRNEEYETTGKFLYNGNTFEILAIDGNYLKIKIISGENQGQETYIKYGQEAASNGYFEKVEATSTDDGTDNENSTETLDRLDLNLLGHIYKGYFNKTDAEWNELEKSEMIVQYAEDIQNGKSTVCDVVSKILTEEELNNSSISDDEFVKRLYKAFTFKEEPSSDEIKSLTNQLTSSTDKKSRSEILEMFLSSTVPSEESFKLVCKEYGIDDPKIIGNYIATKLDISDKKEEVKTYAEELYKKANINLSEQTKQQIKESIENGKATGTSLVSSVIESDEFKNLKLTDTDYLKTISKICFNEDLSSEDLSKYENLLINGTTRNEILKQFTLNSKFQTICDNLNLTKGDYIASPIKSTGDLAKEYVGNAYTQLIGKDASNIGSVSSVVSGDTTVAKMLQIYVGSTAFNNRKLSNEEYVKSLFNAALQRNPTNEEKETYVKKVESSSKLAVIDDIVKMDELKKICNQYYLTLGKYEEYDENSKKEVKETNGNVQIVRTEQTTKDGKKVIYLEDVVFDLSKKIKGDVTGDGKIGVEDAVYVLTKAVALTINDKILTEDELNYVDIDKDEMITVKDAQYMLTYYARKSAALNPTWEEVVSGKYNENQSQLEESDKSTSNDNN